MIAALPLALDDDLDVRPLAFSSAERAEIDEDLVHLSPEERAEVLRAITEYEAGTAVRVPREEIVAHIERQRVEALTAEGVDPFDMSPAGLAAQRAAEERLYARAGLPYPPP